MGWKRESGARWSWQRVGRGMGIEEAEVSGSGVGNAEKEDGHDGRGV